MQAFIFCAGFGTRLRPLTDTIPKALVKVNGVTLLERNITYLKTHGVRRIILNAHYRAEQIIQFLRAHKGFGLDYAISVEQPDILETGGALLYARDLLQKSSYSEQDFITINADILTDLPLQKMFAFHRERRALASVAVSQRTSSRALLFDKVQNLCAWQRSETKDPQGRLIQGRQERLRRDFSGICASLSARAFSGVSIFSPDIFNFMTLRGTFTLIDLWLSIPYGVPILAYENNATCVQDVGSLEKLHAAEKLFL